jgi:hypothetical protein
MYDSEHKRKIVVITNVFMTNYLTLFVYSLTTRAVDETTNKKGGIVIDSTFLAKTIFIQRTKTAHIIRRCSNKLTQIFRFVCYLAYRIN